MGRFYRGLTLMGFACFILVGCRMSAAVEPINFDNVITAEAEAQNYKQVKGHQDDNTYRVDQADSSSMEALENDRGLYQNWSDKKESSRESTLGSETSKKRNRVMKANGEESCRLLVEGVDSSDNE